MQSRSGLLVRRLSKDAWLVGFRVFWNLWLDGTDFWTLERARASFERFISDDYGDEPVVEEANDQMIEDTPAARSELDQGVVRIPRGKEDIAAYLMRYPATDLEVSRVKLRLVQDDLGNVRERCRVAMVACDEAIR